MSRRASIVKAFAEAFKAIDGSSTYKSNIFNNSYPKLKFWDEVNDFPCIYAVQGPETREYLPGGFKWGFLNVSLRLYTKDEEYSSELLEDLLEDVEKVITDINDTLVYDSTKGYSTTEITIASIVTDEGLLKPYGVAEVTLIVRYQIM